MTAHSNPSRINERAASMTYVTGLNVAAISIGRVSRWRGTKLGVRNSSGKNTSVPAFVAAALRVLRAMSCMKPLNTIAHNATMTTSTR